MFHFPTSMKHGEIQRICENRYGKKKIPDLVYFAKMDIPCVGLSISIIHEPSKTM